MYRSSKMQYIRIPLLYLRVSIMHELQYRANFVLQVFQSSMGLVASLAGVGVVASNGRSLNGWTAPELLVVVSIFMISLGIIRTFVQPSLKLLMEQVRKGTLDFTLLKPVDPQLLVSVQRMDPWKLMDVTAGMCLLVVGLAQAHANLNLETITQGLIAFGAGLVSIYSAWIMLATLVFWFMRAGELLDIANSVFDQGRWPVALLPTWLRFGLTFVVPAGFAVSLPAEAVVGSVTWVQIGGAVAYAAFTLVASRGMWRFALRHYSGASA